METPLVSKEYDGKPRRVFKKTCLICEKTYFRPKHTLSKSKFCSVECQAQSRITSLHLDCPQCFKKFKCKKSRASQSKSGILFCSRKCKDKAQSVDGIFEQKHSKGGIHSYRIRALTFFKKECVSCGYEKDERMLEVDHIDGNRKNGKRLNLQILCIWCHALKTKGINYHAPCVKEEK